jgi:hypothetical protein
MDCSPGRQPTCLHQHHQAVCRAQGHTPLGSTATESGKIDKLLVTIQHDTYVGIMLDCYKELVLVYACNLCEGSMSSHHALSGYSRSTSCAAHSSGLVKHTIKGTTSCLDHLYPAGPYSDYIGSCGLWEFAADRGSGKLLAAKRQRIKMQHCLKVSRPEQICLLGQKLKCLRLLSLLPSC